MAARSRPGRHVVLAGSLVLSLAFAATSSAGQKTRWIEVISPHFRIISDADESHARRVAREFEIIRSVFRSALPTLVAEPRRPLTILATQNEDGLISLLPQFNDSGGVRPVGAFLEGSLEHHIVLRVDSSRYDSFRPIYHEYFHLLTSINTGRLPTWLMEGLADVYANTAVRGSTAEIGNARLDYLDLLVRHQSLPLATLLAEDTDPHEWDALDASIFYAQSWASAHFLLLGDRAGNGKQALNNYIARVRKGEDAVTAFEASVGPLDKVQRALAGYIRRDAFYAMRMNAPPSIDEAKLEVRALSTAETLVARARVLSHGGHTQLARLLLAEALAANPSSPLAYEALGLLEWYQHRNAEAAQAFAEAIRLGSTSYIPYYLSALNLRSESTKAAVDRQAKKLRRAVELNPRFAPAYASLAIITIQYPEGNAAALDFAQTATELEPNAPEHWLALAQVWLAMNRPDEARSAAERGLTSARAGKERTVVTRFLDSLEGARAHYLRGNALRSSGDAIGAADAYRTAISLAPNDAATYNGLGIALRATGNLEAAVQAFRETVRFEPGNAAGHSNLANALHARGAILEAIVTYRLAIRLDPDHGGTHRALGDALRDSGQRQAAIAAYRRAIELDQNDDRAKRKLEAMVTRSLH